MKNRLLFIVTAVTLLFSPFINFAQAPPLGSTVTFVLFSTDGAVTNGGVLSQLTGNVGNNNGALSGFGNVNGVMHKADTASAICAADLLLAYDSLQRTAATFFPLSPIIGDGDTLEAGVYAISAVTTLDSILYLDAEGDSSATFIFKIGAAFNTNPFAKIKLINGAQACNVFWRIVGAMTADTGAVLKGTFIAQDAIILSPRDTLEGRALSMAGAVTVSGVLAYTPIGCGSPVLTGPFAPTLGSTDCYAIFSGNGAVTNTGLTTHVTGDVGTNVTTTTGFNPSFVTGTIHEIPDSSTAKCAADLITLHTYLDTLPYDIQLLYPDQFGNELVLTPHKYLMNAAATFTGTVYLNAQGDSNAVFVIRVKGAFATATFSKVELINGTKAANVFWDITGAVDITDSSVFNGTIVCGSGAIQLGGGVTLNGRAMTVSGALSTANILAIIPPGTCNKVLPVNWLYFTGKPRQDNVLLEWSSSNEINNGFFTIEKSRDGSRFERLAIVNASGDNGKAEYHYSFTDQQPYSIGYYRISQTDIEGRKNYFRTIKIKMDINQNLNVIKYVQQGYIYVQSSGAAAANGSIELHSIDGRKILSQKIKLAKEPSTYKIDKALQKGIYLLTIISRGEKLYYGKVMVP